MVSAYIRAYSCKLKDFSFDCYSSYNCSYINTYKKVHRNINKSTCTIYSNQYVSEPVFIVLL